jgi:Tol biopolymer transport system component
VVFDHTARGATDLWAIDTHGGAPRRLTDAPPMEWRAARGRRDGEVVFIDTDTSDPSLGASHIGVLDLASGVRTSLHLPSATASYAGDWLYYVNLDLSTVRRARGGVDEVVVSLGSEEPNSLAVARDGRWLVVHANLRKPALCLVETAARTMDCLRPPDALIGRGDFASSGNALYYGRLDGIHRLELATRAGAPVVPGAQAFGGLAVAPDGKVLVYSRCREWGRLVDPRGTEVIVDERAVFPAIGRGGGLAYVRAAPLQGLLIARDPDGKTRVLTAESLGVAQHPSFDDSGTQIAFAVAGARPGIYVVDSAGTRMPRQLTDNATDTRPIWLDKDTLLFTRADERRQETIFLVSAGGGEPRRVHPSARFTQATLHAGPEAVISDGVGLYLWNARTGEERALALPAGLAGANILAVSVSFDDRFLAVHAGVFGQQVWKLPLADPAAGALFHEVEQGDGMDGMAFTEDGRLLVGPTGWAGELVPVDGRFE